MSQQPSVEVKGKGRKSGDVRRRKCLGSSVSAWASEREQRGCVWVDAQERMSSRGVVGIELTRVKPDPDRRVAGMFVSAKGKERRRCGVPCIPAQP